MIYTITIPEELKFPEESHAEPESKMEDLVLDN